MYFAKSNERMALFIDGQHLYSASRNLGFDVDYKNMLEFFRSKADVVRAHYYCAIVDNGEYSPLKPLTDWLAYNGYAVLIKQAKEYVDSDGRRRTRGSVDLEMVTDMFELAPRLQHIVLMTGAGDFRRPVEALKSMGVRLTVVSSRSTSPAMVADELRRACDEFVDLADIAANFTRSRGTQQAPAPTQPVRRPTPAEPFVEDETQLPASLVGKPAKRTATA